LRDRLALRPAAGQPRLAGARGRRGDRLLDAGPLLPHLEELDRRGFRYYFLYTLLDYPAILEPGAPALDSALETLRRLAGRIGPARIVWRYDPILIAPALPVGFHEDRFGRIAEALRGATESAIISFYDEYPFTRTRLRPLAAAGLAPLEPRPEDVAQLARFMAATAASRGWTVRSCAERIDLRPHGIPPGRCIDPAVLKRLFGLDVPAGKDKGQRPLCGCAPSRDIGAYDTCRRGCLYCYASKRRLADALPAARPTP